MLVKGFYVNFSTSFQRVFEGSANPQAALLAARLASSCRLGEYPLASCSAGGVPTGRATRSLCQPPPTRIGGGCHRYNSPANTRSRMAHTAPSLTSQRHAGGAVVRPVVDPVRAQPPTAAQPLQPAQLAQLWASCRRLRHCGCVVVPAPARRAAGGGCGGIVPCWRA